MKKAKNSTTVVGMLAISALTLASISSPEPASVEPEHGVHAGTITENA